MSTMEVELVKGSLSEKQLWLPLLECGERCRLLQLQLETRISK